MLQVTVSVCHCMLILQARFGLLGLKDDAFPRLKLFKKGSDTAKPVDYGGPMKDSKEMLAWTVEQTGVFVGVKVRLGNSSEGASAPMLMPRCSQPWQSPLDISQCLSVCHRLPSSHCGMCTGQAEACFTVPSTVRCGLCEGRCLLLLPVLAAQSALLAVCLQFFSMLTQHNVVLDTLPVCCMFLLPQGQVKELDSLAQEFVAASAKQRQQLFSKAKEAADAVDTTASPDMSSYVEYYIKTMQRVLDKGDSYLQQVGYCVCVTSNADTRAMAAATDWQLLSCRTV